MDHQPAPQTEVINTVGAGDAYTAALIFNLASGENVSTANSRAVATAAIVCRNPEQPCHLPAIKTASLLRTANPTQRSSH
jgi:fructokinase